MWSYVQEFIKKKNCKITMQKNLMKKNIFKKTTLITLFSLNLKIYDKKTLFVVVFDLWNVNKIVCFPNNTIKPYLCLI